MVGVNLIISRITFEASFWNRIVQSWRCFNLNLWVDQNSESMNCVIRPFKVDDSGAIHGPSEVIQLLMTPWIEVEAPSTLNDAIQKLASRSIRDIIRFTPTMQCCIFFIVVCKYLQQNHLLTLMPRKLSRKAWSECLLKAFLSTQKARH